MAEELINKVALSPLQTVDLADYYPREAVVLFDLKPYLYMELIIKEKEFRASLQAVDWKQYQDKIVALTCSTGAIIPVWAYMLVASHLQPFAKNIIMGDEQTVTRQLFINNIHAIDPEQYRDQKVVVKGCGDIPIGDFAYMEITKLLLPVVKSIMYGEPCSTVPIYKKK